MKARLVLTTKCNRACEGCCNESIDWTKVTCAKSVEDLEKYEEVIITGGEPCLNYEALMELAIGLKRAGKRLYLQTAWYPKEQDVRGDLFMVFDGITYTLHDTLMDDDLGRLDAMAVRYRFLGLECNLRLNVDWRIWERLLYGDTVREAFSEIREMEWKDDCPIPEGEELVYWV